MKKAGFTLVEIILVIALMGLIVGLTVPFMNDYYAKQQLYSFTDEVVANLRRAQNKAIIGEGNTNWGIVWHNNYYAIVQDPENLNTEIDVLNYPENIIVSGSNVSFNRLTGKINTAIIININSTTTNEQRQITINTQGTINS